MDAQSQEKIGRDRHGVGRMSRIEYLKNKDDICGLDKAERRELMHLMIHGEEELSYLEGKLEGMELALKIINRRDVDSNSVRWLVREMDSLRNKINEVHGGEEE